ncbi:MAG: extracellular solute-binding protein [Candidatus Melainabacteria bacterium]|nr:extracellular solute-binding protein [Candidatus Melainabacteria bacterium]
MQPFAPQMRQMIAQYEQRHPNVHVHWVDVPFSEGEKRALTAMLSPNTPDVINLNPSFSAILASRNALLDMNQWTTPAQRALYLPVVWQSTTFRHKTVGVPWYVTSQVTFYNRGLLQRYAAGRVPSNAESLAQLAKTMRHHPDSSAYAVMPTLTEGGQFLKQLLKQGVPLWEDAYPEEKLMKAQHPVLTAVFARQGAATVLDYWKTLYQQRLIPADALTEGHRAAVDRYQSGQLALLMAGANFLNIVKENAPTVYANTGIAPQFPTQSAYTDFSPMVLVVPKRSKHPKQAVDFALFVTNTYNQLLLCQQAPVLPSTRQGLKDPMFAPPAPTEVDPAKLARALSAKQLLAATQPPPLHPRQREIHELVDYYVQAALLGEMSAQVAMAKAEERVSVLLKEE